jgi:hypothetical protein
VLGGEVPDLETTPCGGCQGVFAGGDDVVWDAWHPGDPRLAAYPYHRRCAAGVMPPAEPDGMSRTCGLCGQDLTDAEWAAALAALHARFAAPKATSGQLPAVAWRLVEREPARAWTPDHLSCLLGRVGRSGPAMGLPGKVVSPDDQAG